jgi:2'-5' RNA ligase
MFRLFFALKPPPRVARQVDHFAEQLGPDADRVAIDRQHVTMGITPDYGDYPYAQIKALTRAATAVAAEPFDLLLDRLSLSGRSAALRPSSSSPPIRALHRRLSEEMRRGRVAARPGWSFSPHQTLFYRNGAPDQRAIEGFGWHVEEFVLVCSHVGRTRHQIIGRWPLTGDGQYELF